MTTKYNPLFLNIEVNIVLFILLIGGTLIPTIGWADEIDPLDEVTMQIIDLQEDLSQAIPRVIEFPANQQNDLATIEKPLDQRRENPLTPQQTQSGTSSPHPTSSQNPTRLSKPSHIEK